MKNFHPNLSFEFLFNYRKLENSSQRVEFKQHVSIIKHITFPVTVNTSCINLHAVRQQQDCLTSIDCHMLFGPYLNMTTALRSQKQEKAISNSYSNQQVQLLWRTYVHSVKIQSCWRSFTIPQIHFHTGSEKLWSVAM